MAETTVGTDWKSEQAQATDRRQESWKPALPLSFSPLFDWPPRPLVALKYVVGLPGYFLPWNVGYMALAVVVWLFLTPEMAAMTTFQVDWIAYIYGRNLALLLLIAGAWHFRLYVRQAQGNRYKYNPKFPRTQHRRFLFGNQTWDNMFWSCISGCGIWSAYEVVTLWMFANGYIPMAEWAAHPVYFVVLFCAIPLIRDAHFYFMHRLLHYKFLYRSVHALHHNNVNIGPWSGLSMHPVEHLLYFSGVLIHWVLLSHPLHAIFHLLATGLTPAQGHAGFDRLEIGRGKTVGLGQKYYHFLHHRYFECNYGGDGLVPLDKWFGSFHDGTEEAHAVMRARQRKVHGTA